MADHLKIIGAFIFTILPDIKEPWKLVKIPGLFFRVLKKIFFVNSFYYLYFSLLFPNVSEQTGLVFKKKSVAYNIE